MNTPTVAGPSSLAIGIVMCGIAFANGAAAESVVYRFEAERFPTSIAPPEGTVAASAAALPRLSGTFGFETGSPVVAGASSPGRVSFGTYDTGFITVDGLDLGGIAGNVSVRVTDGVPQADDPRMTIVDEVLLGTAAVSTDAPIDALSLRLRYIDAERLQGVDLPVELSRDDIAEMRLMFSTRVDAMSNRADGQTATVDLLGLVAFDITVIERIE